ncbi:hypothetical protein [Liquorilactobacillus satsumensis]|nr:hypothetical protein [Liquorilactobacillus satsumensis]MCP9312553.1 hypothetical protein [Liquorilactobacillus satsumensis]MCP9328856.1 hypothetical protein [Liquorilactobacillus satsumensis]MCP9356794.1 hypothetical protein [Liquorilactobacillus satsumensis]MCP9360483.1 hypothetical protein [Liquorilactobacillus satsumensis]MCP9370734.1 hypothetical protein [Liquorilactobacillus satsumensis]
MTTAEKELICTRIDDVKVVVGEKATLSPATFVNILNALKQDISTI